MVALRSHYEAESEASVTFRWWGVRLYGCHSVGGLIVVILDPFDWCQMTMAICSVRGEVAVMCDLMIYGW